MGFLQASENFAALFPSRAVGFCFVNVDVEQRVGLRLDSVEMLLEPLGRDVGI
jgi:hypothetical protein